jgi:hypothetical protein
MKRLFVLTCALLVGTLSFAFTPRAIDEKLLHAFNTSFPHAEKVNWLESSQVFIVSFVDNGVRSRITYQKDGVISSYIRYYFEEGLPATIRLALQRSYPGKKVWGVVEVSALPDPNNAGAGSALQTAWYVKLESASTWMTVRIDAEGNLEVTEKYRKAK